MKSKSTIIIIVLAIICIALLACVCCLKCKKESKKELTIVGYADSLKGDEEYDENMLFVEVENTSGKDLYNIVPVVTFYNENGIPEFIRRDSEIKVLKAGEHRVLELYDTYESEYKTLEVDIYTPNTVNAEGYVKPEDLRSYIELKTSEEPYVDEDDGTKYTKLNFVAKNTSDKEISLVYQIEYRTPDNKLVYEDTFTEVVGGNKESEGYEYIATTYDDGKTTLPEGTTHKLILAEAVEYVEK